MATPRARKYATFTIADDARELIKRAENQSQYVERLIRRFPPPTVSSLIDLGALIRDRHPAYTDADGVAVRGLPTFGGDPPRASSLAASWSRDYVLDLRGEAYTRDVWDKLQQEADNAAD